jgi:hypothetical protein
VDMIIGKDNPEWMPFQIKEEPYKWFTLIWMSLSLRYILHMGWNSRGPSPGSCCSAGRGPDRGSVLRILCKFCI